MTIQTYVQRINAVVVFLLLSFGIPNNLNADVLVDGPVRFTINNDTGTAQPVTVILEGISVAIPSRQHGSGIPCRNIQIQINDEPPLKIPGPVLDGACLTIHPDGTGQYQIPFVSNLDAFSMRNMRRADSPTHWQFRPSYAPELFNSTAPPTFELVLEIGCGFPIAGFNKHHSRDGVPLLQETIFKSHHGGRTEHRVAISTDEGNTWKNVYAFTELGWWRRQVIPLKQVVGSKRFRLRFEGEMKQSSGTSIHKVGPFNLKLDTSGAAKLFVKPGRNLVKVTFGKNSSQRMKLRLAWKGHDDFMPIVIDPPALSFSPSDLEKRSGCVLFGANDPAEITPTTHPTAKSRLNRLQVKAAQGEKELITFALYALADIEALDVSVEGLEAFGAKIEPIRYLQRRPNQFRSWHTTIAEVLEPNRSGSLKRGLNQQYALTVQVPNNAPAGQHIGRLVINRQQRIPVKLTVYPFQLKTPPNITWGLWADDHRWFDNEWSDSRILEEMSAWRACGINAMVINPWDDSEIVIKDGRLETVDLSRFRRIMRLAKSAGVNQYPVVSLRSSFMAYAPSYHKPFSKKTWDGFMNDLFIPVIDAFEQVVRREGWAELIYYALDEPNYGAKREAAKRVYPYLHKRGLKTFTTIGAGDVKGLGVTIDFLCVAADDGRDVSKGQSDRIARYVRDSGKTYWLYGSGCYDLQEGTVLSNRYLAGVLLYKSGATGMWSFTYQRLRTNPYHFQPGQWHNWFMTVPSPDGKSTYTTVQWEGLRQGINDYKYLYTLNSVLNEKDEKFSVIRKGLNARLDALAMGKRSYLCATRAQLDEIRGWIAEQIIHLDAAKGR